MLREEGKGGGEGRTRGGWKREQLTHHCLSNHPFSILPSNDGMKKESESTIRPKGAAKK
jgi:hypothetical protein